MTDSGSGEPTRPSGERPSFSSLGANYQPPTLEEVQALVPRDEVLSFIGHGGMGTYYKANQPRLERMAAIKVLVVDAMLDATLIEDFKQEARAMAGLTHQNIIKIYDFGQTDSKLFMIMEHVEGQTLEYLIQQQGFGIKDTADMLLQVCDALHSAHKEGVLHRDLRLGNTMLDSDGCIKVGDFGMARLIGEELFRRNLLEENQAMGTMEYLAPEQCVEDATVDIRADIFSVGVMLYKLATRTLPKERFVPPSHFVPDINPLVDEIVITCMNRRPENRYQSIKDLKAKLKRLKI